MNQKTYSSLFAVFVLATLLLPTIAANNVDSTSARVVATPSMVEPPELATVEGIFSAVDYWGGVTNVVASVQNATEYGNSEAEDLLDIVEAQMASDDGYVSNAVFTLSGITPFPNGVIGGPTAILEITVKSILEVPAIEDDADFAYRNGEYDNEVDEYGD